MKRLRLRGLVVFWAALMAGALLLLASGMVFETLTLNPALDHLARDRQSLTTGRAIEEAMKRNDRAATDRLIDQLGWELVSNQEKAIHREMRESFDEHAPNAELTSKLSELRQLTNREMDALLTGSLSRENQIHRVSLVLIGAVIGIAVGGSFFLYRRVYRPIVDLMDTSARIGAGDLSARVRILHEDELADLGQTFNRMADSVQARELDNRQILVGATHEIRNPLALVKNAAMLVLETPLPAAERAEWLQVVTEKVEAVEAIVDDLSQYAIAEPRAANVI